MKSLLLTSLLAVALGQSASAVTLSFDDIPGGSQQNTYGDMPTGYMGFNFSSTLDWIDTVGATSPWPYGSKSGDFTLVNNNLGVGTITDTNGADFTFDGVWARTFQPNSSTVVFTGVLSGYNNGSLVWSRDTAIDVNFQFFAAQAGMIDELRLGFGGLFIVDDLMLNGGPVTTPIPEPSTYALMLLGLGVMGVAARGRRQRH